MTDTKRNQDKVHAASPMLAGLNRDRGNDRSSVRRDTNKPKLDIMSKINESKKPIEEGSAASESVTTQETKSENVTTQETNSKNVTTQETKPDVEKAAPKKKKAKESTASEIAIELITPWGFADRPDDEFGDDEEWHSFVQSIRQDGIDQPVTVRPKKGGKGYELICGRRRYTAALECNMRAMPCIVRDLDDMEAALLQDRENEQRKDLSVWARAKNWQNLLDNNVFKNSSQLGAHLGLDRRYVNKVMVFTRIEPEIEAAISNKGNVSMSLAQELVNLTRVTDLQPKSTVKKNIEAIVAVADKISIGGMTGAKLKSLINKADSDESKTDNEIAYDKNIGVVDGTRYITLRKDSNGTPTISILKEARELITEQEIAELITSLIVDSKK
ncbi:hypothetical protein VCR15J2_390103 [Vibrio coralliirubri]|uniref:ParB/RepB/Spo0J family partition protein n=1 Tax=Vibrio coralliirubri TaxID=1516159 RepID=UPI000630E1B6|nr:ParB/RepB/Spo0J family partition protein [Vibrio coralliirubri]CDT53813.1 hypothetical protein VCR15J2_390103 [Vibrio coralliirubri]